MTPRIHPLDDQSAPPAARPILDRVGRALGMVPNLHRTLAHAPAALEGYVGMAAALGGGALTPALREQIAVAVAGLNGCAYCAAAHTTLGKGVGIAADELSRNLVGGASDPRAAAALRFARALVERRGAVDDADLAAVRAAGFDERQIVEIVAHVGLNVFTNTFNNLARTTVDFPQVELADAR